MGCKYCTELMENDVAFVGDDLEDGVGEWSMERLSDGIINLAYSEQEEVLASIEIHYCPFCGQRLS